MRRPILLPLRGTSEAEVTLSPALALALLNRVELHLLYVIAPPPANRRLSRQAERVSDFCSAYQASRYLWARATHITRVWGVHTQVLVERGPVPSVIVQVAEQRQVGLIVLATHQHSRFKQWLFGSISQRIARLSPIPVLLVPVTRGALHPDEAPIRYDAVELDRRPQA